MNKRQIMLGISLSLTLVAVGWARLSERENTTVTEAVRKSGRALTVDDTSELSPLAMAGDIALEKLRRRQSEQDVVNVLGSRTWYVPPPPPPPRPPPVPTAPPLPYTYMGMIQTDPDNVVYFLVRNDRVYTVKPGEVIDDNYRLDEAKGSDLVFTYIPMDKRQTLKVL